MSVGRTGFDSVITTSENTTITMMYMAGPSTQP